MKVLILADTRTGWHGKSRVVLIKSHEPNLTEDAQPFMQAWRAAFPALSRIEYLATLLGRP